LSLLLRRYFPLGFGFTAPISSALWYESLAAYQGIANPIYTDLYYGVILSATSVSITVATLKEFGKLEDSKVGKRLFRPPSSMISSASFLLSLIISLSGSTTGGSDFNLLEFIITDQRRW
jgi:Kef-type K+ transport system membrane component KefB